MTLTDPVTRGIRPLRIAFIGAGNMAGLHLRALQRVPTAHTIVGVHDVRTDAAQAFAQRAGTRACATLSALLEETQPDIAHICTPAGMHFEPARQALLAGAHVYVEKPLVETAMEAEALFELARRRQRFICAGYQLVRDPAFTRLVQRVTELQPITFVDSYFAFRPPRLHPHRSPRRALAEQLLDIVPHPLYTLIAALEQVAPADTAVEIVHATATATELHAQLRAGEVNGRLCISLRARPVASTLTIVGTNGTLTTDFIRSIVVGAANEGTSPIEKIANPFVEAGQLARRSFSSLAKRFLSGGHYPGLVELMSEFYAATTNGRPPLSIAHMRRVTVIYEELAAQVRSAVAPTTIAPLARAKEASGPLAVVTGAAGFFGRAITRALVRRGYRVRGISRSPDAEDPHVQEWRALDLSRGVSEDAFAGATVVVHAAVDTTGGYDGHRRNTIEATRNVLGAMHAAGVRRLVYVSSLSVLRPPKTPWERQDERTALAPPDAQQFGSYAWGKCEAERVVADEAPRLGIATRMIRPAALVDWTNAEVPGLVGRRLFGRWHLGFGRPAMPFAACDLSTAADTLAWCADHFSDAPPIINLMDPAIRTRGQLLDQFRMYGWRGRMVWTPISLLAGAAMAVRFLIALGRQKRPQPLDLWSILRPRRYDTAVASTVLSNVRKDVAVAESAEPMIATARVRRAYG